jgi:hypothetical protein
MLGAAAMGMPISAVPGICFRIKSQHYPHALAQALGIPRPQLRNVLATAGSIGHTQWMVREWVYGTSVMAYQEVQ